MPLKKKIKKSALNHHFHDSLDLRLKVFQPDWCDIWFLPHWGETKRSSQLTARCLCISLQLNDGYKEKALSGCYTYTLHFILCTYMSHGAPTPPHHHLHPHQGPPPPLLFPFLIRCLLFFFFFTQRRIPCTCARLNKEPHGLPWTLAPSNVTGCSKWHVGPRVPF